MQDIVFSIGGVALSITGIILTIRYFQKSFKNRRQSSRRP